MRILQGSNVMSGIPRLREAGSRRTGRSFSPAGPFASSGGATGGEFWPFFDPVAMLESITHPADFEEPIRTCLAPARGENVRTGVFGEIVDDAGAEFDGLVLGR